MKADIADSHPFYQHQKAGWVLMRKRIIPRSLGKDLNFSLRLMHPKEDLPTILEIIAGMIGYYLLVIDVKIPIKN